MNLVDGHLSVLEERLQEYFQVRQLTDDMAFPRSYYSSRAYGSISEKSHGFSSQNFACMMSTWAVVTLDLMLAVPRAAFADFFFWLDTLGLNSAVGFSFLSGI